MKLTCKEIELGQKIEELNALVIARTNLYIEALGVAAFHKKLLKKTKRAQKRAWAKWSNA